MPDDFLEVLRPYDAIFFGAGMSLLCISRANAYYRY